MNNRSKRKWLEAPLNFVEINNPLGSSQTNPQANAWWVVLFIFSKKCFFSETPSVYVVSLFVIVSVYVLCLCVIVSVYVGSNDIAGKLLLPPG